VFRYSPMSKSTVRFRVVLGGVDRLHHKAVRAGFQVVYLHLHTDGDDGIALLDEIVGAHRCASPKSHPFRK